MCYGASSLPTPYGASGSCFNSPAYGNANQILLTQAKLAHGRLYQSVLTSTVTQTQINTVLNYAQQVTTNFNNTGVTEQWRSDGSSTSSDIFQNISSQLISKTTQYTQLTIPQMTETQVSNNLNWVAQNPGADYNWIYDQVYNTGGLSTTMNIWGSAAQNLGVAAGQFIARTPG